MKKILHTDYKSLCDYDFDNYFKEMKLPPANSVVYVPMDHFYEFVFLCEQNPDSKYVTVMANSDYGLFYQKDYSLEKDIFKWLRFIDTKGLGYRSIMVDARGDLENCKITDSISQKIYSWTKATFSRIPPNIVKMFSTNFNVTDDRVERLPFGIPSWSENLLHSKPKEILLYINWQNNNIERQQLYSYYASLYDSRVVCEKEVPVEQYVDKLARSKYVLSPPGNGLSGFRTVEALLSNTIPIVPKDTWSECYNDLPVLRVDSMVLDIDDLERSWQTLFQQATWNFDGSRIDLDYWKSRVESSRNLLTN